MKKEKTVSQRIVPLVVGMCVLTVVLISLITAALVYQLSRDARLQMLRHASDALAADVAGWFQRERFNCAQTVGILNALYDRHGGRLDADERRAMYQAMVVGDARYIDAYDAVGDEFVSGVDGVKPPGFVPTQRPWYKAALAAKGRTAATQPYLDAGTGEICMTFARTVAPDGGGRGVFGIDVSLGEIKGYVQRANYSRNARLFIANGRGEVVMHPDPALQPAAHGAPLELSVVQPELWKSVHNGDDFTVATDHYGRPSYFIAASLPSTDWYIVSSIPVSVVTRPIVLILAVILAAFALITVLTVALLKSRIRTLVSTPLDSLTAIVDNISAENSCPLINTSGYQAEFRLFAESFKQMCELRHLATHDALSGLYNRGAFFAAAGRDFALMQRQGDKGCALMLDIDHFKRVNDTYGHSTGDKVIVGVAAIMRNRLRLTDISGRYGGEEFCAWLPDTDADGARSLAEALRETVAGMGFTSEDGRTFGVTVSIGFAVSDDTEDVETLLKFADAALYAAKAGGRNRVVDYGSLSPS
ncbi:MAG: sensor domain-containing diguanylate cyclase [Acidobacteriota bacterium]|jgi:diguanylate cyclase (GGDEF)-like protein|nr:sensor domain-containing diguanylate cyclase [Acidobacteriota bacterium]